MPRSEIAEAVYHQMLDMSYSPGGTVSPATIRLASKVASLAPDKDSRVYFVRRLGRARPKLALHTR